MFNPDTRRRERGLIAAGLALLALAVLGPTVEQAARQHQYADQATRWGIPHALDVLTNLPFALFGLAGLWLLWRTGPRLDASARLCVTVFLVGLVATCAGSSAYHLAPDDAGLALDRLGMAVAFAGMLALAVHDRVSARAGLISLPVLLVLAALSVQVWRQTGNLLPWGVVQFGGMLTIVTLATLRPVHVTTGLNLLAVIAWYAVAKLAELADHEIHQLTGGRMSGHNLKHLLAALAAWPVLAMLWRWRGSGPSSPG